MPLEKCTESEILGGSVRVLLLQPSLVASESFSRRALPFLPLGLAAVAAVLRESGHQVRILDAYTEGWDRRGLLDNDLIEIGLPEEEVAAQIRRYQPHMVGFTAPFTAQMPRLRSLARWVKAIHPEIFVLCGGNHPSCAPAEVLSVPEIDAVVLGEAESTLPQLLQALQDAEGLENCEGIAYRSRTGAPVIRPLFQYRRDLDSLPIPAYDLLPMKKYFKCVGGRRIPLMTSRGCNQTCSTCSSRPIFGRSRRFWSAPYLVQQMRHLLESYDVREFLFDDHALLAEPERAKQLFDLMISENLKIHWMARGGIGCEHLDEALLARMKQSGGRELHFDVGSGSRRVLHQILRKSLDLHQLENAISRALIAGFRISCQFVLGSPGETIEEIYETLNFAWKLRSRGVEEFEFLLAAPHVGTTLHDQALQLGCQISPDVMWNPYDQGLQTRDFSALEVCQIRDNAEREFSSRGLALDFGLRRGIGIRPPATPEVRYFPSVAPAPRVRPLRPLPLNDRRTSLETN